MIKGGILFVRCSDGVYRGGVGCLLQHYPDRMDDLGVSSLGATIRETWLRFPLGLPEFKPILGTKLYELTQDFAYVEASGKRHNIPKGFRFDGASIPRFLWPVVGHPLECDFVVGAIIHDFLCGRTLTAKDRLAADRVFDEVNDYTGVGDCKRWTLYRGVRIGAWWVWTVWGGPDSPDLLPASGC
jgi:hypothetical protein